MLPFVETTLELLELMRSLDLVEETRAGGYLTVQDLSDGLDEPLLVARICHGDGHLTLEKSSAYIGFSREKLDRVAHFYKIDPSRTKSSWQSRADHAQWYGGAIRAGKYILSFSGLPEKTDEALMLALAVKLGLLTLREASEIAEISTNGIYWAFADRARLRDVDRH